MDTIAMDCVIGNVGYKTGRKKEIRNKYYGYGYGIT